MKNTFKLLLIVFAFISTSYLQAQSPATDVANTVTNTNDFIFSPRVGYDLPFFVNNTPYINYQGGLELGASLDYYWNWIGVGADFDYIWNKPKSIYPTKNVYNRGGTLIKPKLTEQKINRMFYGIGPSFRWQHPQGKFMAEVNARAGLGHINGGRLLLKDAVSNSVLNFHAGYDVKFNFATKLQLKATYFFNDFIGVNAGIYYIQHYGTKDLVESGISTAYQAFKEVETDYIEFDGPINYREESCNCNVFSLGAFAGVSVKIPTKIEKKIKPEAECKICNNYDLAVTARDKFTQEILPNTDVALKNMEGEIVKTGTTNDYGIVVFNNVLPVGYLIEGLLNDIALETSSTTKDEFKANETLQKEIIYADEAFILEGNAVVCNTNQGIPGVKVTLKNKAEGIQKTSITDTKGKYIFHVKQNKTYSISGKKDSYFSQTEEINTGDFDRNTTLFVKLEICLEKVDCGKALALKNIHYDLDKYFIRNDAKPELNRLVQFMLDNPDLSIEVSSHTDSRGSATYNQTLSQNRATAAVNYIVSQGISRSRISGVGYGEVRLLNECADGVSCSETQHQTNRRTEMKVICPK